MQVLQILALFAVYTYPDLAHKLMNNSSVKNTAANLRRYRKWHRYVGLTLSLLIGISSLTGVLLALKKDVDLLQPPTRSAQSQKRSWLPVEQITRQAQEALQQHKGTDDVTVDRLDIRPDKGIAKVLFAHGYWEVQVDGYSGEVLSVARRHADWIEHVHDGSIVSDLFKLVSMHVLGIGLLVLVISGLWLWAGPIKIRRAKKHQQS